jgi:Glycosyl hydrolase family 71
MTLTVAAYTPAPVAGASPILAPARADPQRRPPILAYYYIWYTPTSWQRAKIDYPALGRYSSDETRVMTQHIKSAKRAGIAGFLVSWKSTPTLNERLAKLITVAEQNDFKLGIVYQGLDFERNPVPAARVSADLEWFATTYASSPAFSIFDKPLVAWAGTWKFSAAEVAAVTGGVRDRLLVLASEPSVKGYARLGGLVDGDAYYWGSVNPDTYPGYPDKLHAMSDAVHTDGGLWIAPAAPGFDARLVGGTTVVGRDGGRTLRDEWNAAIDSSPDGIGLISWNEFSENTHIEPSHRHGGRYLESLADITGAPGPRAREFHSSAPESGSNYLRSAIVVGGLVAVVVLGGFAVRRRRTPRPSRWRDEAEKDINEPPTRSS